MSFEEDSEWLKKTKSASIEEVAAVIEEIERKAQQERQGSK